MGETNEVRTVYILVFGKIIKGLIDRNVVIEIQRVGNRCVSKTEFEARQLPKLLNQERKKLLTQVKQGPLVPILRFTTIEFKFEISTVDELETKSL